MTFWDGEFTWPFRKVVDVTSNVRAGKKHWSRLEAPGSWLIEKNGTLGNLKEKAASFLAASKKKVCLF